MLLVIANLLRRYKNIARCGNRNHAWGKVSPYVEVLTGLQIGLVVWTFKNNLRVSDMSQFVNSAYGKEKLL